MGSGGVGFRLAFIGGVVRLVVAFVVNFGDVRVGDLAFRDGLFDYTGRRVVMRTFFVE